VKNLYFAGEVLDIVGNRGGFNLQFAWASGYLVGKSLGK
jgi:predicted flavoprotein YhiN